MTSFSYEHLGHVSLTAADPEKAVDFCTRVFGAEVEYRMGPFDAADMPKLEGGRDWTGGYVNVPGAPMAGSIDLLEGPCAPSRSWYVLDPFGNPFELVEYH